MKENARRLIQALTGTAFLAITAASYLVSPANADWSRRSWALVVIPDASKTPMSSWPSWLDGFQHLKLNLALAPSDLTSLQTSTDTLIALKEAGRLEPLLRLSSDAPLPILYDLDGLKPYLPQNLALPLNRIHWPEDVTGPIARGRRKLKQFFGEAPQGFVPGGGSLSQPVVDFLKAQKFGWTIGGFSEAEWPAGTALSIPLQDGTSSFKVLSAHGASDALHPQESVDPSNSETLNRAVQEALDRLEDSENLIPVVVFDEARSPFPAQAVLALLAAEARSRGFKSELLSALCANADAPWSTTLQIWPHSWSWVRGNGQPSGPGLTAWIGDLRKNLAWEQLAQAHGDIERYQNSGQAEMQNLDRATDALHEAQSGLILEEYGVGSEPGPRDRQFRKALARSYRAMDMPIPELFKDSKTAPTVPISTESAVAISTGATASSATLIAPVIETAPLVFQSRKNEAAWIQPESEGQGETTGVSISKFAMHISSSPEGESVRFSFGLRGPVSAGAVLDLYMDINHRAGAGVTNLLTGRNAIVPLADGWEYVFTAKLSSGRKWVWRLSKAISPDEPALSGSAPADKDGGFRVSLPKNALGRDPLRWGFLVCIMKNEAGPLTDFLSPVAGKEVILDRLNKEQEKLSQKLPADHSASVVPAVLPMLRAE